MVKTNSFKAVIIDPIGLHARPISLIVSEASKYNCDIKILANKNEANLKSIINVMALAIKKGDEIEIVVDSTDTKITQNIKNVMIKEKLIASK